LTAFQKFMPWVIIAPFANPVVPEVYMIVIRSSWIRSARPPSSPSNRASTCSYGLVARPPSIANNAPIEQRRCSSSADWANEMSCTINAGELSFKMYSSSVTVKRQFNSTQIAPRRAQANCRSKNSTPLWANSPTLSPRPIPSEARYAAIASMRRSRSA
jgi:hypothetical protein